MVLVAFLAAQIVATPIDPLAGWGALFLQGGSFALLCYIIGSLWPKVSKESRDEREKRDDVFGKVIDKLETSFDTRQRDMLAALDKQVDRVTAELARNAAATEKLLTSIKIQTRHDVDEEK